MKNSDVVLTALIEWFLDIESQRQGVPMDTPVAAEKLLPDIKEALEQSAYEAVAYVADARDSLPSWSSPTGDVPSMQELRGRCQ